MAETMVERAALAIKAKVPLGYGMTDVEASEYARAVIEAMREPTEAMIKPTYDLDVYWGYYADGRPGGPDDVWRAMLDAALQEPS